MSSDDRESGRPYIPRRAGIADQECPEKSKLVDALLRGEDPAVGKKAPRKKVDRRWGDPRTYLVGMRRWVPAGT